MIKAVKQISQEKNIKHVKTSKQTKILGVKIVYFSAPDSSKKILFNQDQPNEPEKVQSNKKSKIKETRENLDSEIKHGKC